MSSQVVTTGEIEPDAIEQAVALLRAGALVAFPTETVYGLGADATNPAAVARIFALKGRPSEHPLIVHLGDPAELDAWVATLPPLAARLAAHFWPGPLTLILPKAAAVPTAVTGGQDSVGIRVPSHPVARRLLQAFGGGIAAPSANRYGRISPTCAAHVRLDFGDALPLVLDGGAAAIGLESTIVSCLEPVPRLLRPGHIGRAELAAVVGPLAEAGDGPRAPGDRSLHYAPLTPIRRVPAAALGEGVRAAARDGLRVGVLARRPAPALLPDCIWIDAGASPVDYARGLYAHLRDLDAACGRGAGRACILVESPPVDEAWAAVNDRLQRACGEGGSPAG